MIAALVAPASSNRLRRGSVIALVAAVVGGSIVGFVEEAAAATATQRISLTATGTQSTGGGVERPAISADGRFVAFESTATNVVTGDTNAASDIFVRDRVAGTTVRVSVGPGGVQATGSSTYASISADGRYVAFQSTAPNLVADDTNNLTDVFVRDLQSSTTTRVSVSGAGAQGNGTSDQPMISGNGRVVAFRTAATNLVANEIYAWTDIVVRDLDANATERVSVTETGANANGNSQLPAISFDGRYVAFDSYAFNINGQYGDANSARDVYRRDRQLATSVRISLPAVGEGNADSLAPSISANGRFVAFESIATNLVAGDTNAVRDVFVRDAQSSITTRVSVSSAGVQGNGVSEQAGISPSGRTVAFRSTATNLVAADTNNQADIVARDRYLAVTSMVSVSNTNALANNVSGRPSLSSDGRYVAFRSVATNLVVGDSNGQADAFVRDRDLLATPDLVLATSDVDPVELGSDASVTFTTTNAGAAGATQVTLAIVLPPGAGFVGASAGCSEVSGTVTCPIGAVGAGGVAARTVTYTPSTSGPWVVSGSVTAEEVETSTANNAVAESTLVVQPNLGVALTATPDPVVLGEEIVYAATVANAGLGAAPATEVVIDVAETVVITSVTVAQGSCEAVGAQVSCALGTLAAGSTVDVIVRATPEASGTIDATAVVTTAGVEQDTADDAAAVSALVQQPDVSITKTDLADPVARLDVLAYEIVVTNDGDGVARDVTMTDPLPADATFAGATTTLGSCAAPGGTLTCALGDLAPGGAATITVSVVPQVVGALVNQASVATTGVDADPANDSASADTTVTAEPEPNLRLTLADLADPVRASETLQLSLVVDNLGSAPATGVRAELPIPAGTELIGATPTLGSCAVTDGVLGCELGALAPLDEVVIAVELDPTIEQLVTSTGSVSSIETDFDPTDNVASHTTLVGEPRLDVALAVDPTPRLLGADVEYVATVTNHGTAPATGVLADLTLPPGTVHSIDAAGAACGTSAPISCELGTIDANGSTTLSIVVVPDGVGVATTGIVVTAGEAEADTADNAAAASVDVIAPDLAVVAVDDPDPVDLGQPVVVTVTVANAGTAPAPSVGLTIPVPGGGAVVSSSPSVGSCALEPDGSASCSLGDLDANSAASVSLTVLPGGVGTMSVLAVATTTGIQPDVANDVATVATVVRAPDLVVTNVEASDPRALNQIVWYTTTVRNDGDRPALGVAVATTVPAGSTFSSAYWSGGSCPSNGAASVCTIGTINPGQTVTTTMGVVANVEGSIDTTSTATSTNVDANPANNVDTETTKITALSQWTDNTYQTNGKVDAIVYSGDVVYLAGDFTSVRPKGSAVGQNEVARSSLAAFSASTGQVLAWNPAPNGRVNSIVVSEDGATVYVGGLFTTIGGQTRLRLAALSASTGLATAWNPSPDGEVRALALAPGGSTIYAGGFFGVMAGQPRVKLAAVSTATGAAVAGWDPVFTYPGKENLNVVAALTIAPDGGAVYAGGLFKYVDGVFHNSVVKIDAATGSVVDPWDPGLEVKSNRFETNVYELAIDGTKLFVCGDWYRVGGVISPNLVAVDTVSGSKRTDWIATTDGAVNACTVSARRLYIGGHFDRAGGANADGRQNPSPTGAPRQHLAALDLVDGALDPWDPGANSVEGVYALDATATRLGVGGTFDRIGQWVLQQGFGQFSGIA